MLVESVRLRLLLVAPLRLVLGLAFLGAARAAGGRPAATLLAFAAGAFAMAFLVPNDPRARFRRVTEGPAELPADARVAPAWLHAVHAALPSTVGVSLLTAISLAFQPALSGLLAGILAGLGFAAGLAAYGMDGGLYLDPRTRAVFRRPADSKPAIDRG
jgi:RsiW-degrading membrane proteinase PrsW (M82 family)